MKYQDPGEKAVRKNLFRCPIPRLFLCCLPLLLAACASSGASSSENKTGTPTPSPVPTQAVTPATPISPRPSASVLSKAPVTYSGHTGPVIEVVWSLDGKSLVSCGNDGTVQVWSASDGHMLWKATVARYVFAVAWSPDGQKVAAAGVNGALAIFTATNGHLITTIQTQSSFIEGLAWSPDSHFIASGSQDNSVAA